MPLVTQILAAPFVALLVCLGVGGAPAAARAPRPVRPPAAAAAPAKPPASRPPAPAQPAPAAAARGQWQLQDWGNPATVTARTVDGEPVTTIAFRAGKTGKVAIARETRLNLTKAARMVVKVSNTSPQPIAVAVAFKTMPGWDWYESAPRGVKANVRQAVPLSWDLTKPRFKCEKTKWRYATLPANMQSIREVILLVYPCGPTGTVAVSPVEFHPAPAPGSYVQTEGEGATLHAAIHGSPPEPEKPDAEKPEADKPAPKPAAKPAPEAPAGPRFTDTPKPEKPKPAPRPRPTPTPKPAPKAAPKPAPDAGPKWK